MSIPLPKLKLHTNSKQQITSFGFQATTKAKPNELRDYSFFSFLKTILSTTCGENEKNSKEQLYKAEMVRKNWTYCLLMHISSSPN